MYSPLGFKVSLCHFETSDTRNPIRAQLWSMIYLTFPINYEILAPNETGCSQMSYFATCNMWEVTFTGYFVSRIGNVNNMSKVIKHMVMRG